MKKPRNPAPGISPEPRGSTNDQTPLFSFTYWRSDTPRDLASLTPGELAALLGHLRTMSAMTWAQLTLSPRQGLGSEKVPPDLDLGQPGDATLLAFRVDERARLIGFRVDRVLHLVCFDPKHQLWKG